MIGMAPVKDRDVTDPSDQRAVAFTGEQFHGSVSRVAVDARDAHLDELVVAQGATRFRHDRRSYAGIAYQDDRVEMVRQPLQVAPLFFGEFHPAILAGRP